MCIHQKPRSRRGNPLFWVEHQIIIKNHTVQQDQGSCLMDGLKNLMNGKDFLLKINQYVMFDSPEMKISLYEYTLWITRMEHSKYNRGCNMLPKLVQTLAPSVLFPVFNPPYPQGRLRTEKTSFTYHTSNCSKRG